MEHNIFWGDMHTQFHPQKHLQFKNGFPFGNNWQEFIGISIKEAKDYIDLGAGVTRQGTAMYATGTVECITPVFSSPVMSKDLYKNNFCTYNYTIEGMYTTVAFSLTGGNILKWFRDEWADKEVNQARQKGIDAYELILEQIGTRPGSLLVLPYWTPSGTPYFDIETPRDLWPAAEYKKGRCPARSFRRSCL